MQSTAPIESFKPYPASWVNRLVASWDGLGVPFWVPYGVLWLVMLLLKVSIKWWDGSVSLGHIPFNHVVEAGFATYGLFLLRFLERAAREALEIIRPSLGISNTRYSQLEYQLSTAPATPAWLATLFGMACGALYWLVLLKPLHPKLLFGTSAPSFAIDVVIILIIWGVLGVLFYTALRQVQIIRHIYTLVEQINLMLPQPLYGLSSYTLRAAVGGTLYNYGWLAVLLNAAKPLPPEVVAVSLGLEILIVVVFVLPLWGIHLLLLEEKRRLQAQLYERIRQATADLHQSIDESNLERVDPVQKALSSLQIQQAVLDRASTWPWHPETFRILSTAIAAPLVLWFVQRILSRLLG